MKESSCFLLFEAKPKNSHVKVLSFVLLCEESMFEKSELLMTTFILEALWSAIRSSA